MPQLDHLTFFSQFFWLCVFYLGFYFILVKYFLPRMSKILKIRNLKMNSSTGSALRDIKQENIDIQTLRDISLTDALKESRSYFQKTFLKTRSWLSVVLNKINKKKKLTKMNKGYLTSISKLSTTQALLLRNVKAIMSPYSFKEARIEQPEQVTGARNKFMTLKLLQVIKQKQKSSKK